MYIRCCVKGNEVHTVAWPATTTKKGLARCVPYQPALVYNGRIRATAEDLNEARSTSLTTSCSDTPPKPPPNIPPEVATTIADLTRWCLSQLGGFCKTPQKSALRSFIRQEQPQTGVSQPVRFETWPRAGLSICRITSCSHRLRGFEQDSAALGGRPAHSCDRRTCLTEQQTTNV